MLYTQNRSWYEFFKNYLVHRYNLMIRKKLLIKNIKDIEIFNENIKYRNKYIFNIELCGICLENSPKYFRFLDYTGEIGIFKKKDLEIPNKRCLIFCNLYIKKEKNYIILYRVQNYRLL
jgi:epoxyqueuosine reductase QueG